MVSVAHFSNFKNNNTSNNKIPEYAKDFKNEWLYIVGINRKCGQFIQKLQEDTVSFEEVFSSSRARALVRDFKNVLEAQKMGRLQNISQLKFKISAVEKIIELRIFIYLNMGTLFYSDYLLDEDFQYFFENLIIFTNNVNIKNEEDFLSDDIYNISDNENVIEFDGDVSDDDFVDQINILLNNL